MLLLSEKLRILIVRAKVLRGDIGLNIVHVFAVCFSTICIYHRNIIGNSGKGYTIFTCRTPNIVSVHDSVIPTALRTGCVRSVSICAVSCT